MKGNIGLTKIINFNRSQSSPDTKSCEKKRDERLASVALTIGSSGNKISPRLLSPSGTSRRFSFQPEDLAQLSDSFELQVSFTDRDESRKYVLLPTDTVALLLDDILADDVYVGSSHEIYQLVLSINGNVISLNDWNKRVCDIISPLNNVLAVHRRKDTKPPFMDKKLTKKDIWMLCAEMRMPYQTRLKREKELRKKSTQLPEILANLSEPFKTLFIEALNEKNEFKKGTSNKMVASEANGLHMVVIFCFQDFLSKKNKSEARDEFMEAIATVVFKAAKTKQKRNALRILVKWLKYFRGRDFSNVPLSPDQQSPNFLIKYYKPILEQLAKDEDLQEFSNEEMPSLDVLSKGRRPIMIKPTKVKAPTKNLEYKLKADYIYCKSLHSFDYLDAGDFANCKHNDRRSKKYIKELTLFTNETSYVVAYEILNGDNPCIRGEIIDEWIRIAHCLLQLRDYHSAQGVVGGLSMSCIYRLKKSWEFATKGNLLKIVKDRLSNNNYADQRAALLRSMDEDDEQYGMKIIPFIGMIQKDLEKVDQIPKVLDNESINKRKYELVAKCVSNVISQTELPGERTFNFWQIDEKMRKLYDVAAQGDPSKSDYYEDLNDKADDYVKKERAEILCNQGARSKLVTLTLMNVLTLGSLWYMFYVYVYDSKTAYQLCHWTFYCIGCLLSCYVTTITVFENEQAEDLDHLKGEDTSISKTQTCCSSERAISYFLDAIGLGIIPAFWRAWRKNVMYENIYDQIDSWKKEFSLQNSVTVLFLHLPLVVLFVYTKVRSLEITKIDYYMVLIFPLMSVCYTIFHMFRGAHETIFLVSGRTIVFAGFISLCTDFLLRVGSVVGLSSYLLRAAMCIDQSFGCIEEMIAASHGEDFCDKLPANGLEAAQCCECEGGSIPDDTESLMYRVSAMLIFAILFAYEFSWVVFFHYRYNNQHAQVSAVNEISGWKKFMLKIVQATVLMVSFATINIPLLGMYRPKYRQVEHCIRVIFSIIMTVLFIFLDDLLDNTSVMIGLGIVIPVHIIAYIFFERAFTIQEDEERPSTNYKNNFFGDRFSNLFSQVTTSQSDLGLSHSDVLVENKTESENLDSKISYDGKSVY